MYKVSLCVNILTPWLIFFLFFFLPCLFRYWYLHWSKQSGPKLHLSVKAESFTTAATGAPSWNSECVVCLILSALTTCHETIVLVYRVCLNSIRHRSLTCLNWKSPSSLLFFWQVCFSHWHRKTAVSAKSLTTQPGHVWAVIPFAVFCLIQLHHS